MLDACVIGDSPAALAAALELAEVGLRLRVVRCDRDAWPDRAVRDPEGSVRALVSRLGRHAGGGSQLPLPSGAEIVDVLPRRVLLGTPSGEWAPVPEPSVLGIPAVPASEETLAFVTGGAAVRAYLDRVKPLLTIGKTAQLGALVRNRMGRTLQDRLVEPLVRDRFGVSADEVDVAIAAPGLNETLTRAGSLSGAVLAHQDRAARGERRVRPRDGWGALREALIGRLALYGVEFSDEPDIEARALVIDPECVVDPLPPETLALLEGLAPSHVRAHAALPIDEPSGLPDGEFDAVQTVALTNGEQWSVRIERSDGWLARLAGPRAATGSADPAAIEAAACEALAAVGLSAVGPLRHELRAAPFVALGERDGAEARIAEQREREPEVLLVGRDLHGGSTSAAVADALAAAVPLRRRLAGIAE